MHTPLTDPMAGTAELVGAESVPELRLVSVHVDDRVRELGV
jgi:hypothetical protein